MDKGCGEQQQIKRRHGDGLLAMRTKRTGVETGSGHGDGDWDGGGDGNGSGNGGDVTHTIWLDAIRGRWRQTPTSCILRLIPLRSVFFFVAETCGTMAS